MERDERAALIFLRELRPGVEHQRDGRPVRRKGDDRRFELRAAAYSFSVAAVLGIQQQGVLRVVVEAVRPAEVVAGAIDAVHRLGRTRLVILRLKQIRPQLVQRIAVVHHQVKRAVVPRDRDHLPKTGGVPRAVGERLSRLVLVEPPDAAVGLE